MSDQELRALPHDAEAEAAVLGACLLSNTARGEAATLLTPGDFYGTRYAVSFKAMLEMDRRSEVIDGVSLADRLESDGLLKEAGGRAGLMEMAESVASAVNIVSHCKIVRQHALRRALIRLGYDLRARAERLEDAMVLAAEAQQALFSLVWGRESTPWKTAGEVGLEGYTWMENAAKQQGSLSGITTGLADLDAVTGGWQRADLVVVGARPSMGKTAFALGVALAAAFAGSVAAFLSLEMSTTQLGLRVLSRGARRNLYSLRQPRSLVAGDWSAVFASVETLQPIPFFIDDNPMMTLDSIRAKVRALKARNGLDLLLIDYVQLIEIPRDAESRQKGLSDISRGLKLLAKELDITVVVLSQLSRECERREDKRPILSDLRESGAIEQDADIVIMLYRDQVYNEQSESRGIAELILRKHRNGPTDIVRAAFVEDFASFENLAREGQT